MRQVAKFISSLYSIHLWNLRNTMILSASLFINPVESVCNNSAMNTLVPFKYSEICILRYTLPIIMYPSTHPQYFSFA